MYEAQAWMGSSAALLGRAHLVGPNPYASLVLVQGGPLKGRLPKMQTPYLVSSAGAAPCTPLPIQLAKPSVIVYVYVADRVIASLTHTGPPNQRCCRVHAACFHQRPLLPVPRSA